MGRYIKWDDVIDRYPELNTLGGAEEISSSYIVYAEAHVDGMLANHYTIPFSRNNMIIRDLSIDYTYWRAARFKFDDATQVKSAYFDTLDMIKAGQLVMIDDAGTIIEQNKKKIGLFSTTESYHSAFGMRNEIDWHFDENQLSDEQDRFNG